MKYEKPKMDIIKLEEADIITLSDGGESDVWNENDGTGF